MWSRNKERKKEKDWLSKSGVADLVTKAETELKNPEILLNFFKKEAKKANVGEVRKFMELYEDFNNEPATNANKIEKKVNGLLNQAKEKLDALKNDKNFKKSGVKWERLNSSFTKSKKSIEKALEKYKAPGNFNLHKVQLHFEDFDFKKRCEATEKLQNYLKKCKEKLTGFIDEVSGKSSGVSKKTRGRDSHFPETTYRSIDKVKEEGEFYVSNTKAKGMLLSTVYTTKQNVEELLNKLKNDPLPSTKDIDGFTKQYENLNKNADKEIEDTKNDITNYKSPVNSNPYKHYY